MSPQLKMLVWREWRERRTLLLAYVAWMLAGTIYCIAYALSFGQRAPVASFYTTASLFGLVAPIFAAMRTSLGELGDGSRTFSDALPVSPRKRGWVRLAGGASALVVPIVAGAVLLTLLLATGGLEQAPQRPPDEGEFLRVPQRASLSPAGAIALLWIVAAVVTAAATSLYVLLALVGTWFRALAHLGFAGAAIAALWFLSQASGVELARAGMLRSAATVGAVVPQSMITNFGYGTEQGSYGDLLLAHRVFVPLLVNLALQVAVAALFVRRYARRLPRPTTATARRGLPPLVPMGPPLPTRAVALGWLALRQSVPMCLPGLALACLMTPLQMTDRQFLGPQGFADYLPSAMWVIGILWAVVVGAGVFAPELNWRVGEFWRGLPIPRGGLFAAKFFLGLLAVLLVLDGTAVAAAWNSPDWGSYWSMNWPYVLCIVPLHATMFALAVAWTCGTRRPVLGAIAALTTFALVNIALSTAPATQNFEPIEVYNNSHFTLRPSASGHLLAPEYPIVLGCMALAFVACAVVAWWSLGRYDPARQSN